MFFSVLDPFWRQAENIDLPSNSSKYILLKSGREGTIFNSTLPLPPARKHSDIYLQLCMWDDYHIFLIALLVFTRLLLDEIYHLIVFYMERKLFSSVSYLNISNVFDKNGIEESIITIKKTLKRKIIDTFPE